MPFGESANQANTWQASHTILGAGKLREAYVERNLGSQSPSSHRALRQTDSTTAPGEPRDRGDHRFSLLTMEQAAGSRIRAGSVMLSSSPASTMEREEAIPHSM